MPVPRSFNAVVVELHCVRQKVQALVNETHKVIAQRSGHSENLTQSAEHEEPLAPRSSAFSTLSPRERL